MTFLDKLEERWEKQKVKIILKDLTKYRGPGRMAIYLYSFFWSFRLCTLYYRAISLCLGTKLNAEACSENFTCTEIGSGMLLKNIALGDYI